MTEPEEEREKTPKTDAILHPPTANPRRTRCDADQGDSGQRHTAQGDDDQGGTDQGGGGAAGTDPVEEES